MSARSKLINKKFGRLTVQSFHSVNDKRHSVWKCICQCGNTRLVVGAKLKCGDTRSCGCLRKKLPKGKAAINRVHASYIRQAKKRGLSFSLSRKKFESLIFSTCFYCGIPFSNIPKFEKFNGKIQYNGIDRINNKLGYTTKNCVTCCKMCNSLKKDYTYQDFKEQISKIYSHWAKNSYSSHQS